MASTNAIPTSETNRAVGIARLVRYGLLAALAASVANALVLVVALAAVDYPAAFVGGPFGPLAMGPVVGTTAVAAIGATLVYGALARYAARPNRTFTVVAGAVLVLSFGMFLAPDLSGAPPSVFATLAAMHVIAAVTVVGVLTRAAPAAEEGP